LDWCNARLTKGWDPKDFPKLLVYLKTQYRGISKNKTPGAPAPDQTTTTTGGGQKPKVSTYLLKVLCSNSFETTDSILSSLLWSGMRPTKTCYRLLRCKRLCTVLPTQKFPVRPDSIVLTPFRRDIDQFPTTGAQPIYPLSSAYYRNWRLVSSLDVLT
jgi:hypothetical protein